MITRDAWLKAVDDAQNPSIPESAAITIAEFAEMLNVDRCTAGRRMRKLIELGKARLTKKLVRRVNGAPYPCPAYLLVEAAHDEDRCQTGRRHPRRQRNPRPGARARRR